MDIGQQFIQAAGGYAHQYAQDFCTEQAKQVALQYAKDYWPLAIIGIAAFIIVFKPRLLQL